MEDFNISDDEYKIIIGDKVNNIENKFNNIENKFNNIENKFNNIDFRVKTLNNIFNNLNPYLLTSGIEDSSLTSPLISFQRYSTLTSSIPHHHCMQKSIYMSTRQH